MPSLQRNSGSNKSFQKKTPRTCISLIQDHGEILKGGERSFTRRCDVYIPSIDTTVVPIATHKQGPITRSRAKQLNYQVLSFLGTIPHIHENMMLPKSDVFLTLRNDGPSMDERDKHWSMAMHGDGSKHVKIQEKATDGDFKTLRPP